MSVRALELEHILLRSPQDKFDLAVRTTAWLGLPDSIGQLDNHKIVKVLSAGQAWVDRGRGLRSDIKVQIKGDLLSRGSSIHTLETIGHQLCHAPLWTQLSLLTTLDFAPPQDFETDYPHFSIHINHEVAGISHMEHHPDVFIDHTSVVPLHSIPIVELLLLEICFDYSFCEGASYVSNHASAIPISALGPDPKARKADTDQLSTFISSMSCTPQAKNFVLPSHRKSSQENLENTAEELSRTLCRRISEVFEVSNVQPKMQDAEAMDLDIIPPESSQEKQAILREWVATHKDDPYPTPEEKSHLMRQTGYAKGTIANHLNRFRKCLPESRPSGSSLSKDTMLEISSYPQMWPKTELSIVGNPAGRQDEVILSQDSSTPSLTTISPCDSVVRSGWNHLSSAEFAPMTTKSALGSADSPIDVSLACKISETALRTLIGGYQRSSDGLQAVNYPRVNTLSALAPSLFNPGFKRNMAHNSLFVATISSAISGSWPVNAQGAGLNKKLSLLAHSTIIGEEDCLQGEVTSLERLSRAVQSRLWGMMHRKMFDTVAVKKLWSGENKAYGGDPDILMELHNNERLDEGHQIYNVESFAEEELEWQVVDEFEDLLLSDDEEGLLSYLEQLNAENERLEIERETDEMLLGCGWSKDEGSDQEEMLLGGDQSSVLGSEGDSMLL